MEQPVKNVIGERVRALRVAAKLTQNELVARCQVAGLDISRVALGMLESGRRGVSDYEVQFLALALDVSLLRLFPEAPRAPQRKHRNPLGRKSKAQARPTGRSTRETASRKKSIPNVKSSEKKPRR
jgi:transcriptional regulator with XRE-family HTH domain